MSAEGVKSCKQVRILRSALVVTPLGHTVVVTGGLIHERFPAGVEMVEAGVRGIIGVAVSRPD